MLHQEVLQLSSLDDNYYSRYFYKGGRLLSFKFKKAAGDECARRRNNNKRLDIYISFHFLQVKGFFLPYDLPLNLLLAIISCFIIYGCGLRSRQKLRICRVPVLAQTKKSKIPAPPLKTTTDLFVLLPWAILCWAPPIR
jgi:hypothetical protein